MLPACTGIAPLRCLPRCNLAVFAPARPTGPVGHPCRVRPRSDWRLDAGTSVVHVSDLLPYSLINVYIAAVTRTRVKSDLEHVNLEPAGGRGGRLLDGNAPVEVAGVYKTSCCRKTAAWRQARLER